MIHRYIAWRGAAASREPARRSGLSLRPHYWPVQILVTWHVTTDGKGLTLNSQHSVNGLGGSCVSGSLCELVWTGPTGPGGCLSGESTERNTEEAKARRVAVARHEVGNGSFHGRERVHGVRR